MSGLWILALVLVVGLLVGQDVASALSGVLYLRSSRAWEVGDHQQALELLEDAAWFDPESVAVQNQEGYLWFQMDDLNRAQAAFARAVDTDSTNGPALNNLAVTYFATGAAEQAMSLLEDAARYDPDGAIVYYNQGLILLEQQDLTGAVRALKEASHIKPEWSLPHIYLSYVYLQLGDYGQAEQSARSAIRLAPAVEMVHLILAMTLYHQDRSLDALEPVRRALDLAPEDSVARFYNALILRDLGMPGIARTKLEQLLASSDDSQQQARIAAEIETITRSLEQSIWEE